jgi:hypothetical protein
LKIFKYFVPNKTPQFSLHYMIEGKSINLLTSVPLQNQFTRQICIIHTFWHPSATLDMPKQALENSHFDSKSVHMLLPLKNGEDKHVFLSEMSLRKRCY